MTRRNRLIALLISVVMIISVFSVAVFAAEAATDEHGHEVASKVSKGEIITNIVIIGIIVIVAVVLIIKFRAKLGAFLRSVKSELKKIVWASGSDTRKNFLVVIVITVVIAAVIGILDFAFSEGIAGIVKLLKK